MENWNVLLLEAGGDETEISDVPLMAGYLQLSKLDWQYKTEPQGNACLGKGSILRRYSQTITDHLIPPQLWTVDDAIGPGERCLEAQVS